MSVAADAIRETLGAFGYRGSGTSWQCGARYAVLREDIEVREYFHAARLVFSGGDPRAGGGAASAGAGAAGAAAGTGVAAANVL
jgi:hypothetical protein